MTMKTMKMFKGKRFWLILLICLTMVGVGAGYTMGSGYTSTDFNCDGKNKGVYAMEVEYLGPDASSIVVESGDVVAMFYDVETGDVLSISGEDLKDGNITRFHYNRGGVRA